MTERMDYYAGTGEKSGWLIKENGFFPEYLGKCEAIFCQGNGYLGQRAALEEEYAKETRNLFVTGTFDKFDENEVTELPNLPDMTNMEIFVNGRRFCMDSGVLKNYERQLDLKTGVLTRNVEWVSPDGVELRFHFERFVSLSDEHTWAQKVEITPQDSSVTIKVRSGIDGCVTNTGTQHFHEGSMRIYDGSMMEMCSETLESEVFCCQYAKNSFYLGGEPVDAEQLPLIDRRKLGTQTVLAVDPGQTLTVEKICGVYTSRDRRHEGNAVDKNTVAEDARSCMKEALKKGYEMLKRESCAKWEDYWKRADIRIDSMDSYDQLAVRFALYHLNIMIKRDDDRVGIGAKGLSGEGYKGHSFWDTEIFLLPHYLFTDPPAARTLLSYRGNSIPGALKKAQDNGYQGAMFPWESAWLYDGEVTPLWGGADVVTGKPMRILTGILEQHISADVAFAVWQYFLATGDEEFMDLHGYEIIAATALFWTSRAEWNADRTKCVLTDVIGPDEYKEHVDNNAYTNYLVHHNLLLAEHIIEKLRREKTELFESLDKKYGLRDLLPVITETREKLYLPMPDENGILPQFDRYFELKSIDLTKYKESDVVGTIYNDYNMGQISGMQVSKQADTILLMMLFPDKFTRAEKHKNYRFYEERTLHDSSLSKSTHCIMAAQLGNDGEAYRFFRGCLDTDLGQTMTTSDMGIHSASMGGIWQSVIYGFGGVSLSERGLDITPRLPKEWRELSFSVIYQGCPIRVLADSSRMVIKNEGTKELTICHNDCEITVKAGESFVKSVKEGEKNGGR